MRAELEELLERWPVGSELDLNQDSVVYIVGGYKGITAELISQMYNPQLIRAYEPQDWAFKVLMEVAMAYPNIEAYHFGLGTVSGQFDMGEWGTDACSFVNIGPSSREHGIGTMIPVDWVLGDVEKVDLMMINCEGSEFDLIPYMREKGLFSRINKFCIQWHLDLKPEYEERLMDSIITVLETDGFQTTFDDRPAWTLHVRS